MYGENCLEIINKVGRMADMEDNEFGQADIAHRTSKKKTSPIIILSYKKSDRQNFYKQKKKLYSLNVSQLIDNVPEGEDLGNEGNEEDLNKNFLNKSCTGSKRKLYIQVKK